MKELEAENAKLKRDEVIEALMTVLEARPRWGFWKCDDRLRLDGQRWTTSGCTACIVRCG